MRHDEILTNCFIFEQCSCVCNYFHSEMSLVLHIISCDCGVTLHFCIYCGWTNWNLLLVMTTQNMLKFLLTVYLNLKMFIRNC